MQESDVEIAMQAAKQGEMRQIVLLGFRCVCVCVYIYLHNSTKGSTTSDLMVAKPPLDAVFNTKWVLSTPKGRLLLRPYPEVSVQFRWVQVCRQAPQGPDECCAVARC